MSKNIVFFSDFHANIFDSFAKPDSEFVNDRFRAQIETLNKVYDISRENNAILVFGGDLFHTRSRLEDVVFNNVFKTIAQNNDVETYLLRGNHDSKNNSIDSPHWLEAFKYLDNVTVMDLPKVYTLQPYGIKIYAVPYADEVNYLKENIKEFAEEAKDKSYCNILVGHIGVDGSEVGRYNHRLEGAFQIEELYPDIFDYVLLGHYHKRQFLGGRDNVLYAGNTIQTSFSDEGQDKGVFLIRLEEDKFVKPEFIPIPNKKFITLTNIPENVQELVDNHYVRFVLPQDKAQEVEVFKEESDNVRVEVQKEYKTETRIDIDMSSNEKEIVEAYTDEYYPEAKESALEVLQEALSVE